MLMGCSWRDVHRTTVSLAVMPGCHTRYASSQHVQEILHHLVAGRDHLGIGRIGLLRDDQLGEFVGDVRVGAFERGALILPDAL